MKNEVFPKYRELIKQFLCIDDFTADMLEGECNRDLPMNIISRQPFLFHGLLSIITNTLFPFVGLRRNVKAKGDDFIFISCPDPSFRTKTIDLITGDLKYSIIYLPNFHINTTLHYFRFFKNKKIKAFFPTIKLVDVWAAKKKVKGLIKAMNSNERNEEYIKVLSVISSFLIYDRVVKRYMRQVENFNGKWIFEHQKFFFMASVANLHERGIETTMLQHGIFFKPVYDFIPLLCDKVLCCSERERVIYLDNGTASNRVEVLGAPLQTLQLSEKEELPGKHYDLLIMMTMITEKNAALTREVLNYIKGNYDSVLVRMRPRSRKGDEALLSDVLQGMTLSEEGTPISEDILRCDKAVSFSVDANIELSKFHKPFIFIWDQESTELIDQLKCATADNYKEEITKLMTREFYSTFSDDQYKEILGETDVNILRDRFVSYIKR